MHQLLPAYISTLGKSTPENPCTNMQQAQPCTLVNSLTGAGCRPEGA